MMVENAPRVLSHVPEGLLRPLRARFPDLSVEVIPRQGLIPQGPATDVLLTFTDASDNLREAMDRGVKWVHAYGTGVNAFPFDVLGDAVLTCSRGASAVPIAEWALAMILAAEKQLPEAWVHEPPERWNTTRFLGGMAGRTLGLIGLGGIGQAVARRAQAFDMHVVGLRRHASTSPPPGVELASDLSALMGSSDHLVIAAPATPETHHMIGREALAAAKPGLHLINIARGELIDQEALREALETERIALASLDVVEPEPLPAGHWLYSHPKVRLSPHISWSAPGALSGLLDAFVLNLDRFIRGEPLQGRVDLELGY
ncbi:MAG: dihydrofolate reductase [Deltaproteobacteria bacterium]|nr:dihydrofolate reductase [Deltaproteobacteria bacterium]MBW2395375.1 dihydrofolate reductase [Deltaproteobacteria bacterium]